MTAPPAGTRPVSPELAHYNRLRMRSAKRDRNHDIIKEVRDGRMRDLFPSELNFSLSFEGTSIANFVDIAARQMAEVVAPLPALACVSGNMKSDRDVKRADMKNRIGSYYWRHSRLETQMMWGADQYCTYGFLPFFIEPDTAKNCPFIQVEDPYQSYYELDRYGQCVVYCKRYLRSVDDLAAMFPEYAQEIRTETSVNQFGKVTTKNAAGDTQLELIKFVDDRKVCLLLPSRSGLELASYEHKLSRCPVVIAERPGHSRGNPRGQFEDVVWVQVARAIMSILALEAAHTAVQAPIVAPPGIDEFPIGPHAIIEAEGGAPSVGRMKLDLPPTIFGEVQALDNELHTGSRYPQAAVGNVDASVITGKGVEALMGTFDTQVKGAQMVFKQALQDVTKFAFEMDDNWWPNTSKTINGTMSGESYEVNYIPSRDIAGKHTADVSYGFATGMHPAQAVVTMLQLEGAGLIAKGTLQDNLPFSLDQIQEQRKIHIEGVREALKQGLFSLIQASGQMAVQGQDPLPYMKLALDAVKELQDGQPVEDAIYDAFQAMQAAQQQQQAAMQAAQPPPDQMGLGGPGGPPQGQPPGQPGQPPGGAPTVEMLRAGFRGQNIQPTLDAFIQRRNGTGQ